jgi:hypothetical protein
MFFCPCCGLCEGGFVVATKVRNQFGTGILRRLEDAAPIGRRIFAKNFASAFT